VDEMTIRDPLTRRIEGLNAEWTGQSRVFDLVTVTPSFGTE
jgi:hypothetical protein